MMLRVNFHLSACQKNFFFWKLTNEEYPAAKRTINILNTLNSKIAELDMECLQLKSVLFIYCRHEGKECFMLVLLNFPLLLVQISPLPEPDTLENCDLG